MQYLQRNPGLPTKEAVFTLSEEESRKWTDEMCRCAADIDYFIDHYYWIRTLDGGKQVIKMYPKQRQLVHHIDDNRFSIVLASRQVGKTATFTGFILHYVLYNSDVSVMLIANKETRAKETLANIKDAYSMICNYIKPRVEVWNATEIKFSNGSSVRTSATSPDSARGGSVNILVLDEFAFIPPGFQEEFVTSVFPTVSSGKSTKIIVVSTPNGVGDSFHRIWTQATSPDATADDFKPFKIDWWENPMRDENWARGERRRLGEEKFAQEYGNSFSVTAGNKLIEDKRITELYHQSLDSAVRKEYVDVPVLPTDVEKNTRNSPLANINYRVYEKYNRNHVYLMSGDAAEGQGSDYSVLYVFDVTFPSKIELVAAYSSNSILPINFAGVVNYVGAQYGNPPFIMESNSVGRSVFDALCDTVYKYPNAVKLVRHKGSNDLDYGVFSHPQVKSKACLNAQRMLNTKEFAFALHEEDLLDEFNYFIRKSTRVHIVYEAQKGHHDDCIMSFIWALWALADENIEKLYHVEWGTAGDGSKIPTVLYSLSGDEATLKDQIERTRSEAMDRKIISSSLRIHAKPVPRNAFVNTFWNTFDNLKGGGTGREIEDMADVLLANRPDSGDDICGVMFF